MVPPGGRNDRTRWAQGVASANGEAAGLDAPLLYRVNASERVTISVRRRDGTKRSTHIRAMRDMGVSSGLRQQDLSSAVELAYLRRRSRPPRIQHDETVRVVDLFSGCGLMSLGIERASNTLGMTFTAVAALDTNATALSVYKANFPRATAINQDIAACFAGRLGAPLSHGERELASQLGEVTVALGGPPCQGHSDLNNYTRRRDPKNSLYDRMARFAEVCRPTHVIVENVPAVKHDAASVLDHTREHLVSLGYAVTELVLSAERLGIPQRRRRHFLIGTRRNDLDLTALERRYQESPRTVRWAIGDLEHLEQDGVFDSPARPNPRNAARMRYLFDHNVFELPNENRPPCHQRRDHTYKSVYGRLHYDAPAQTITTGFSCLGQGRFVHPTKCRTLTPHEAARLQGIPDFFRFGNLGRTALAELIGNAVPPRFTYLLGLELLR